MNDEMMRAAAFAEPGGPEVLRVTELPAPQAGPGQVRVRVRTAGVQPFDAAVRAGWVPQGLTGGLPRIPGNEFAGVVDQVGEGVTGVSAGAEVLGFSLLKCYAEYVVVPAGDVTGKPASMPWEVAGGLTAGAQTAEPALDALAVGEGDTLLVHAAAGAVGTVAVQVARMRDATVIGTAREVSATSAPSRSPTAKAWRTGCAPSRPAAWTPRSTAREARPWRSHWNWSRTATASSRWSNTTGRPS